MIGYLDTPAGISGDMFLGCLVDAGWPLDALRATITRLKLPAEEWSVDSKSIMKGPLRATLVNVSAKEGHAHRHLSHVKKIIDAGDLPQAVKEQSVAVFTRLAQAEAKVHGTTVEKIHFHEVGAVDAIIDVVGSVAGLHELGVQQLFASPLPLGSGWATTQHGQIPLPAPATLELLAAAHAPVTPAPGPGEHVTPTGAALVAQLATFQQPPLALNRVGLGAGQRETPWPNIARLWLGAGSPRAAGQLVQLETNIDDMNPQLFPAVAEKLFAAGANDVWFTPIQMKKGRPATQLSALALAALEAPLTQIILRETTTLGVRVHTLHHRHEARREMRTVDTPFGQVAVKIKWVGDEPLGATPEFEDCRRAAETNAVPARIVYEAATVAAQQLLPTITRQKNSPPQP